MSDRLTARDRRALLVGIATMGSLLFLSKGVPALRAHETRVSDRLSGRRAQLERVTMRLPSTALDRTRLAGIGQELRERSITAGSAAEATSALVQHLSALAEFSGVTVDGISPRGEPCFADGVALVRVRVSVVGTSAGILGFVRELEVGTRLIGIRSVTIAQPDPSAPPGATERLRAEFQVEGVAVLTAPERAS